MSSWEIGRSVQDRPLTVNFLGREGSALRLLFVCGQHGDERGIRRSLRHFLRRHGPAVAQAFPQLHLAVCGDANPDGFAARTRANAQGIDLNRDHLRLRAPETQALHSFIRQWQPHLVVDFHNYPARRSYLVSRRLRLGWDICIDIPTNPAARACGDEATFAQLFARLGHVAQEHGHLFGRYGLYRRDGSFRHGTPQLGDARNTITLRHEVPALLVEARNPSRFDTADDRTLIRTAVAATAWEICRWAVDEQDHLLSYRLTAKAGACIPLGYRRSPGAGMAVPVRDLDSGAQHWLEPDRDRCRVEARRHRLLPQRYRISERERDLLLRHGYHVLPPTQGRQHWEVNVEQRGGRLLALILDTASRYGTGRKTLYEELIHG